jgi:predicted transposase/invertase (TIGR01784 family)
VELIEYDRLTPEQMHRMKVEAQRKVVRQIDRDEGKKEGLEEGAKDKTIEIARKMKADGLTIDVISKYTGLAAADIEGL